MLILALGAQEIDRCHMAVVQNDEIIHISTVHVPPERYLATLQESFKEWGVDKQAFEGVLVMTGPGSFTATRTMVTIANAIAQAHARPMWGAFAKLEQSFEQWVLQQLPLTRETSLLSVLPAYQSDPLITHPK